MKSKADRLLLIFLLFLIMGLIWFHLFDREVQILCALDLSPFMRYTVLHIEDTHSGFHGDGKSFYKLHFSNCSIETQIQKSDKWQYGTLPDVVKQGIHKAEVLIQEMEKVYWFYDDQHNSAVYDKRMDTNKLSSGLSNNYVIAVYVPEYCLLYYVAFDT